MISVCSPAYSRNYRNLSTGRYAGGKSSSLPDVLISDKHIDVFTNLSLLGYQPVAYAGINHPERRQGIANRLTLHFNINLAAAINELPQRPRYVEDDGHYFALRLPRFSVTRFAPDDADACFRAPAALRLGFAACLRFGRGAGFWAALCFR